MPSSWRASTTGPRNLRRALLSALALLPLTAVAVLSAGVLRLHDESHALRVQLWQHEARPATLALAAAWSLLAVQVVAQARRRAAARIAPAGVIAAVLAAGVLQPLLISSAAVGLLLLLVVDLLSDPEHGPARRTSTGAPWRSAPAP